MCTSESVRLSLLYTCIRPAYNMHKHTYARGAPSHHADLTPGPQSTLPHPLLFFRSPLLDLSFSLFLYVLLWCATTQMCSCAHFIFSERKAARTREENKKKKKKSRRHRERAREREGDRWFEPERGNNQKDGVEEEEVFLKRQDSFTPSPT